MSARGSSYIHAGCLLWTLPVALVMISCRSTAPVVSASPTASQVEVQPSPSLTATSTIRILSTYTSFRILLLHALHEYDQDGQIVYDTLQERFPSGQPGHTSAELAVAFWDVFLTTHDVGQACTHALDTMGERAEDILYWLDGNFHGRQAPRYHPVACAHLGRWGCVNKSGDECRLYILFKGVFNDRMDKSYCFTLVLATVSVLLRAQC